MIRIFVATACALLLASSAVSAEEPNQSYVAKTQAQLLDRVAIEDLIATYLYDLDQGRVALLGDLFTEDAVFEIGGRKLVGRQAIRDYYAARTTSRRTRHVSTNLYITFDDRDHARSLFTLTYYKAEAGEKPTLQPAVIADYDERLTRGHDGKWRFSYRKATPSLADTY